MLVQQASNKATVRQMSAMSGQCQHMGIMPQIVMLRCYGWWWQEGEQNMGGIGDGFIKQLVIRSLALSLCM